MIILNLMKKLLVMFNTFKYINFIIQENTILEKTFLTSVETGDILLFE